MIPADGYGTGDLARVKKSRQSAASDVASGHTNGRPGGPLSVTVDAAERAGAAGAQAADLGNHVCIIGNASQLV